MLGINNPKNFQDNTPVLQLFNFFTRKNPRSKAPYLKERMDSSCGFTANPQYRTQNISPTPKVRVLSQILQRMPLFIFKRESLTIKGKTS